MKNTSNCFFKKTQMLQPKQINLYKVEFQIIFGSHRIPYRTGPDRRSRLSLSPFRTPRALASLPNRPPITEPCQSPEEMDDATATALVVACAEFSLPAREKELFAMAKKLGTAAKRCKIANKKLEDATARLSEADEAGRLDAVLGLRAAATALGDAAAILERACDRFTSLVAAVGAARPGAEEEAARPSAEANEAGQHDAVLDLRAAATELGNAAATLARACDDFAQLVAAIGAVRAGTEEEAARPKGCWARIKAWWRDWRRGTSGGVVDPEAAAPLLARDLSAPLWHKGATVAHLPAAAAGGGQVRTRSAVLAIFLGFLAHCALGVCLRPVAWGCVACGDARQVFDLAPVGGVECFLMASWTHFHRW